MFADIMNGHTTLADWLFLIGAVFFLIEGVLHWSKRPDPTNGALVPFGLMLIAVGWLVL